MRLPVEKIHGLGLPISYKFNSYLTVVKERCRPERIYYFCLFSYWKSSQKLQIIIQLSPHTVHVMTYQLMTTLGTKDTLIIKKSGNNVAICPFLFVERFYPKSVGLTDINMLARRFAFLNIPYT